MLLCVCVYVRAQAFAGGVCAKSELVRDMNMYAHTNMRDFSTITLPSNDCGCSSGTGSCESLRRWASQAWHTFSRLKFALESIHQLNPSPTLGLGQP